ncbi:MAG: hypothetical protein CVV02_10140 [Firmicutes bacterium HGW-Firmicutes-7]|nr:MAG: hypothetical protein CVV02_10140 [Firmicutes bacterium HGW-Firmicutes-7]
MIKLIMDAALISVFWFIALYTLKLERIEQIIITKPRVIFGRKIILLCKAIILFWMIIEAGILIGGNMNFFSFIRNIISAPVISHGLYIVNLFILFTSTRHLTGKALESEKYLLKSHRKAVTFANGLVVLSISIMVFYFQGIYWGEFNYIYSSQGEISLQIEAIIDGLLILLPGIMILVNAIRYLKQAKIRKLAFRVSIPMVLLMGFTQSIMTKLVVFYDFYIFIHKLFLEQFGVRIKNDPDDKLLIASSLSFGTINAKINVYFLTAYFSTIFILWTSQASPLPIYYSVYANGLAVSLLFSIAIIFFWVLESAARSIEKLSKYFRIMFIPSLLILTIMPFYTSFANVNTFIRNSEVISVYHKMALALGSDKILFFLCLMFMQAAVAYILHIVTGEAHNDRHYYSILPIIGIVQVMVLSIMYPIFLLIPPYTIYENRSAFGIFIILLCIAITLIMGQTSYELFTSSRSEWSSYVNDYWKDRIRVILIVGIITGLSFIPLGTIISNPIHNINIKFAWEQNYNASGELFFVNSMMQSTDISYTNILMNDNKSRSKIITISTADGHVLWEKNYTDHYVGNKVWRNNTAVLTKVKNTGFSIIDLKTGVIVYDYSVNDLEAQNLNIEINDRTVLYTSDTEQFVFDMEYGLMKLDTLGNNYYKLIDGDQCALTKNDDVYLYNYERWEKMSGVYNIVDAELVYYDRNGLIVFNKENIVKYNYYLTEQISTTYNKSFEHIMTNNNDYYNRIKNQVAFYLYNKDEVFAYIFDTKNFTYKIISLEQRIKEFKDYQKLKFVDHEGSYFLYDNFQFTLYENENIIARQWFQLPLTELEHPKSNYGIVGTPIKVNGKIIWIEKEGVAHAVSILVQ